MCRDTAANPMRKLDLPSSNIVCPVSVHLSRIYGAVRRYTRAAVPLQSAVFSAVDAFAVSR